MLRPSSFPVRGARTLGSAASLLALLLAACDGSGGLRFVSKTSPEAAGVGDEETGPRGGHVDLAAPTVVPLRVRVTGDVIREDVQRLSINVGKNDPYGAAQLMKNRLPNPGFEAGLFSSVWHVADGVLPGRLPMAEWNVQNTNDDTGVGWPEGFWNGARYEVLSGPAAGTAGVVTDFVHEGSENVFHVGFAAATPGPGDAVATTVNVPGLFRSSNFPYAREDTKERRPGSYGRQSLRLENAGVGIPAWTQGLDTSWGPGQRSATKLLCMEGPWRLSFWAKGSIDGASLIARVRRAQETTFLSRAITLDDQWSFHVLDFDVAPGQDPVGPYAPTEVHPGALLELFVGSTTWVDDMSLARRGETNPTAFTDAYVARLKELGPAVLRHLSRQFGGDLANQLARPAGRRTQGWHPTRRDPQHWDYSLHEFLELCAEVGADPWYCVPTSWSTGDWLGLLDYLAAPADPQHPYAMVRLGLGRAEPWTEAFGTIHLEFGNESWGSADGEDPFWGISLGGAVRLARTADARFALLRSQAVFDPARFDLVIGGQFRSPTVQKQIEQNSSNHDTIALAPYFGNVVDRWSTDEELFLPVFARAVEDVTTGRMQKAWDFVQAEGQGTKLAVYEINFHTVRPSLLPADVRGDLVTGQAGALALPLHQLLFMRAYPMGPMCSFTSLEYAFEMVNKESVRLWGLLRDLEGTGRKRPGWWGLQLVNRAVRGAMVRTEHSGTVPRWHQDAFNDVAAPMDVEVVHSFAFQDRDERSLVLFNLSLDQGVQVELDLPSEPIDGAVLTELAPASIHDDNEDAVGVAPRTVRVGRFADGYRTVLPPHSLRVYRWSVVAQEPFRPAR